MISSIKDELIVTVLIDSIMQKSGFLYKNLSIICLIFQYLINPKKIKKKTIKGKKKEKTMRAIFNKNYLPIEASICKFSRSSERPRSRPWPEVSAEWNKSNAGGALETTRGTDCETTTPLIGIDATTLRSGRDGTGTDARALP